MEIIGYLAAVLIGISLGLIGGGGSILTVPVLVYLFGVQPGLATSYSLAIVGISSLAGAWTNFRSKQISMSTALLFGASSIITVLLTRRFLLPAIPEPILRIRDFELTRDIATMILFAVLMILAAVSMIRTQHHHKGIPGKADGKIKILMLLLYGVAIGLVTGLLGAGGGFLLIPALILLVKLPIKKAIGTSLLIIALNSLIGFVGDLGHFSLDWVFLGSISALAVAGITIGTLLSRKIKGEQLKKGFGWFVLAMGIFVITRELTK